MPMNWIFTPERPTRTDAANSKPTGLDWDVLGEERLDEIPVLRRLERTDSDP